MKRRAFPIFLIAFFIFAFSISTLAFTKQKYTIDVIATDEIGENNRVVNKPNVGAITPTEHESLYGNTNELIATSKSGYEFGFFMENDFVISTNPNYSFRVIDNHEFVGYFKPVGKSAIVVVDANNKHLKTINKDKGSILTEVELEHVANNLRPKPGYVFSEWSVDFPYNISQDVVIIRAVYKSNEKSSFTVSIIDEETELLHQIEAEYGENLTLEAPVLNGKSFSYWMIDGEIISFSPTHTISIYDDLDLTCVYDDEIIAEPIIYLHPKAVNKDKDFIFIAQSYVPDNYKLVDQGVIYIDSSEEIEDNITHNSANVLQKTAQRVDPYNQFAMLFDTLDCHNLHIRAYLVVEDSAKNKIVVYSQQIIRSFKFEIDYQLDGGTNNVGNSPYYSIYEPLHLNSPTREGHTFIGWYTFDDFSDNPVSSTEGFDMPLTLYARWEENTYTTNYVLDGASIVNPFLSYQPSQLPLQLPEAHKNGYSFEGWCLDKNLSGEKLKTLPKGKTGNLTLYPSFRKEVFTLSFVENGGKYTLTEQDIKDEFLKDYYNFLKPNVDLKTFMHGTGKSSGYKGSWVEFTDDGKATLPNLYAANQKSVDKSLPYFINQPEYNKKWLPFFNLMDILVKETNPDQSFWGSPYTGDIRLHEFIMGQRYQGEPRFLSLDLISSKQPVTYTIDDEVELVAPKREGYDFAGWYNNPQFVGKKLKKTSDCCHGDLTLYAKWVKKGETNQEIIPKLTMKALNAAYVGQITTLSVSCSPKVSGAKYNFYSSNINVASVENNGEVTFHQEGSVTLTAKLAIDESYQCSITVQVYPPAEEIEFSDQEDLNVGDTLQLSALIYPSTAYQGITWEVSDDEVATVNKNGLLTAVGEGTVTIIATSAIDESIQAAIEITVKDNRKIIINNKTATILESEKYTISASINGSPKSNLVYTSEEIGIATVNQSGVVTAKAIGTVTITVSLQDNPYIKETVTITVKGKPRIEPSQTSGEVTEKKTLTLKAEVFHLSNKSLTWSSSNTSVATVNQSGVVTGVKAGTATITIQSVADSSVKATVKITVKTAQNPNELTITTASGSTSVDVNNHNDQLYVQNYQGTSISRLDCTFTVSNSSIAEVSIYGTIQPKKIGTVTVTVKYGNATGKITLKITGKVEPLTISATADPGSSLFVGDKNYQIYIQDSQGKDVSRLDCTFTSSNSSVATVSQYGTISGLKAGTATITIKYKNMSTTLKLTIKGRPKITISPSSPSVVVGATRKLTANLSYITGDVTWKSSNTSVATINSSGTVTGKKAGTAVITATSKTNTSVKATVTLKVTPKGATENKRNTIIDIALKERGYREGANNNTKYGRWYGLNYNPWCAMFVSWCANQAKISTSIIPKYASVQVGLNWYRNKGGARYKSAAAVRNGSYKPIAGDIIFFKEPGISHTGLVIRLEGNYLYCIEGNTSDMVAVRRYNIKTYTKITGYGIPAYPASSTATKAYKNITT